uniref:Uncharacterized protein n=1 Tax=Lactuca sativa TaxID=4236 RepID=A0A9R1WPY7_LACSA|nr:hypothetical protein LSAT_V11C100038130 [Lactuca sativa]
MKLIDFGFSDNGIVGNPYYVPPKVLHILRISYSSVHFSLLCYSQSCQIVGVFYKAHEYAEMNPNFLGCAENALGIRNWLESQGHEYIVTDDKEGLDCELEKHIQFQDY